jgi:hypothetical protein
MARRASTSANPLWLITAIAVAIGVVAGAYAIFGSGGEPYRTVGALPVQDYLENANSLRGNVYKLDGLVSGSLEWSATRGRLFSVDVGSGASADVVPVVVPPQFNHVNIERGQRFFFKIEVGDKGVLQAQDVKKG